MPLKDRDGSKKNLNLKTNTEVANFLLINKIQLNLGNLFLKLYIIPFSSDSSYSSSMGKRKKVAWSDESCFLSPYVDTISFPDFGIQGGRVMVDLEKV